MNPPHALATLVFTVLLAVPAARAQEVQVPLDREGSVQVIDADLRARLGLFPDVDGFREARLFRARGGTYELALRYEDRGGRRLRERRALTEAQVDALRRRVQRGLEAAPQGGRARLEDGRYRFLTATTVLGIADAALLVAAAEPDDEDAIGAAALLGGTAGFFVPLLLTRDAKVTEAEATLTGYGGFQGLGHGVLLTVLFGNDDFDDGGAFALTGALSVAEAAAGFSLARSTDMRGGTAETVAISGLFGGSLGASAGLLAVGDDGSASERAVPLGSLAGSVAGAYGGYRLARAAGYTQGDARIFGTAGLVGTQLATTVLIVADRNPGDDGRAAAATYLAGTLGGLALGHRLVRNRDFGEAQGNIVSLGALAGSLAGGAVGTIVNAGDETAAVLSTLGSLGGFLGTYLTYRGEAQAAGGASFSWNVGLAPGGAAPNGLAPAVHARMTF